MLVYDISKRQSFDHVARWVDELRAHADSSIVIMLIGNKGDLVDQRVVHAEDAVEFAEEYQHILRLYKENTKRIDDCRIL